MTTATCTSRLTKATCEFSEQRDARNSPKCRPLTIGSWHERMTISTDLPSRKLSRSKKKAAKKKAKRGAKKSKKAVGNNRAAAAAALDTADKNLAAGQTEKAIRQLRQAMKHLVRWQAQLNMRQKELRKQAAAAKAVPAGQRVLMERLERLERDVQDLRALLAPKR